MDDYAAVLFTATVYVYRVPPRTSAAGCRAAEWGDMEKHLWQGRLRVIEHSEMCNIRLEDADTGDLFAESPYDVSGRAVEATLDSSRCFVLRVEADAPGGGRRKAYIGIADWTRRYKAAHAPPPPPAVGPEPSAAQSGPPPPRQDFSLKEGETLSIKLPALSKREGASSGANDSTRTGFVLPPPPRR